MSSAALLPARSKARTPAGERALSALAALHLSFLPWAFGGVDLWSQVTSLALAGAMLTLALLRRDDSVPADGENSPGEGAWARLRTFPVFWAGLGLMGFVVVQALNPAFHYRQEGTIWWLVRGEHVAWLPAGMDAPLAGNPWRVLLVWGSCWLTVCALWTGVKRRSSVLLILTVVCTNAALFAVFGLLQRAGGITAIYTSRSVALSYFFAALIYKHHVAAYFSLLAFVALGLAIRALRHTWQEPKPSGIFCIYLLGVVILSTAVLVSFSFSGILLFGGVLLGLAAALLGRRLRTTGPPRVPGPALTAATIAVTAAVAMAGAVGAGDFREKLHQQWQGDGRNAVHTRLQAYHRGWEMFQDRWISGWGAGCFVYGFTKYQRREPELARTPYAALRWEHVHNDWLELLIELGVVGFLPIAVMAWFWVRRLVDLHIWRDPSLLAFGAGIGALVLHALVDFPAQCPAVLVTAGALLPLIVRWAESPTRRASPEPRCF